ncbi:AAA family ATPase [Chondromyces apiculatus]|uniref:AAA family ATPase n=1 Tax=Chondromyces apiculatus TaxID=51 RepID=UPI0018CC5EF9
MAAAWNSSRGRAGSRGPRSDSRGTLRILALLMALRVGPLPSMLAIEEPENGVYPGRLRALLSFLREMTQREPASPGEAGADVPPGEPAIEEDGEDPLGEVSPPQMLLTSHSPVILTALRTAWSSSQRGQQITPFSCRCSTGPRRHPLRRSFQAPTRWPNPSVSTHPPGWESAAPRRSLPRLTRTGTSARSSSFIPTAPATPWRRSERACVDPGILTARAAWPDRSIVAVGCVPVRETEPAGALRHLAVPVVERLRGALAQGA